MSKENKNRPSMPERLNFNVDEEAIKLLKNGNNDVFKELLEERKQEFKKEYLSIVKKGIIEYKRIYNEVEGIKEDKPEVRDLITDDLITKAGISAPLLKQRNELIGKANLLAEALKQAKTGNFEPILKWNKNFKDKKQNIQND